MRIRRNSIKSTLLILVLPTLRATREMPWRGNHSRTAQLAGCIADAANSLYHRISVVVLERISPMVSKQIVEGIMRDFSIATETWVGSPH
jgi:hypothetical protein